MLPTYHTQEDFQIRSEKLRELKALGIEPYPHKYTPTHETTNLQEIYNDPTALGHSEQAELAETPSATVAGRLVLFRSMGKNTFAHLQDGTGRIQVMFNRDHTTLEGYNGTEPSPYKVIEKKIDLGDILGVEGNLFYTQKGELTLYAKKVTLLCKTLLPLADKYSGLHDKELRYRKRWLDLITNPDVKDTFRKRSLIFREIRSFLGSEGFMEVETPVLQSIYGGAEARPFNTKLNALNQEMFLRISLEIPLKKLIVGGMERVFEIGKVFRNEGIDRNHNPEFTLLELYGAYLDYNDMMSLLENLCQHLALKLHGKTSFPVEHNGETIELDMKAPWPRLTMKDAIKKFGGMDVDAMNDEQIRSYLRESGHVDLKKLPYLSRGLLIAALFEVVAESHLVQPHHIIDHPIETTPLCKPHRKEKQRAEGLVERFESFVLGHELCNSYTELNDPVIQRDLLVEQAKRLESGDEEASPLDEEFIEAICQGMPPTGGLGIGVDRLVMLLTSSASIRDVLYFPWMKPAVD